MKGNLDEATVAGFGDEWNRFDQSGLSPSELQEIFEQYFAIFPWHALPENAVGFDLGCGSGRWAQCVAPRVGTLHCIDASAAALEVARSNLLQNVNCEFHVASVDAIPLPDKAMDFGYSLGVLHHVPDTLDGIRSCVAKLKPGAPFLIYLYYAFDNRPFWFRALWQGSNLIRRVISKSPFALRHIVCSIIAVTIYLPLARLARLLEKLGLNVEVVPLSFYRQRSFYTMRTDALDRFGTQLEQRFTLAQIFEMLERAGLEKITHSTTAPYWCVLGHKRL